MKGVTSVGLQMGETCSSMVTTKDHNSYDSAPITMMFTRRLTQK